MNVTRTTGKGWVLGVTVPNGVYRMRRNGKEFWTGNSGRAESGSYSAESQPAKGGEESQQAKKIGGLEVSALLSGGGLENLKDMFVIKGNRNEDYWNALKMGRPLPAPGVPFIYDKFIALMKAGGANVIRENDRQLLTTMTDKDIDKMARGEIVNSDTVDAATLHPKVGGLFDEAVTGGLVGKGWGKISLSEPIISPPFEEPVCRLLDLTQKEFRDVYTGKQDLDGKTGMDAIRSKLQDVGDSMDASIARYRDMVMNSRGQKRDNAVKCLRYLSAAKRQDVKPTDWILSRLPVLPPVFRPVSKTGDMLMVADMNDLYRDVIEVNEHLKNARKVLPESELSDVKGQLYDASSAVMGWGEPVTQENRAKRLRGSIEQITGARAKWGLAQNKLFSKTADLVARGVVAPDPEYDMDTVGIPEEYAWNLYRPFLLRAMVRRGFPPVRAREMIEAKDRQAREVLEKEMGERPVLLTRAPAWHKFNIMAFHPRIVDENVIRVSPLITSSFNMDFDGNCVNVLPHMAHFTASPFLCANCTNGLLLLRYSADLHVTLHTGLSTVTGLPGTNTAPHTEHFKGFCALCGTLLL